MHDYGSKKSPCVTFVSSEWTKNIIQEKRQKNGYDCGMHVILSADYLSDGIAVTEFSDKDISNYRSLLLYTIAENEGVIMY